MNISHEEERGRLERVQRELAELWVQGGVWSNSCASSESFLLNWDVPEIASLEELGAIPSFDVTTAFDAYLAKFGERLLEDRRITSAPSTSCNDPLTDLCLPPAFLDDPSSFSLDDYENWKFVFGEAVPSPTFTWEGRATLLQSMVDDIDDALFRETLKKRKDFEACHQALKDLCTAVKCLKDRVSAQRENLHATFLDIASLHNTAVLKRRRKNLKVVLDDLTRIADTFEAIHYMETVFNDPDATDADLEEVLNAYKVVHSNVADLKGQYFALDGLLANGSRGLTEEAIIERRHSKMEQVLTEQYQEGVTLLKQTMRAERWQYATGVGELAILLERIPGTNDTLRAQDNHSMVVDGKIYLDGRLYGVITSIDPLVAIMMQLMHWRGTDKIKDVVHFAIGGFRVFNSMTSRLILGAGAIESAGLKSITVKHLAIACEQIELASAIAKTLFKGVWLDSMIDSSNPTLEEEFDLCLSELGIHADEIRRKIVAVAVELLLPPMKNAVVALGSTKLLSTLDEEDGLMPYFKDLVEEMLRNLTIVARLTRESLRVETVDAMLECICSELVVWLRDGAIRLESPSQRDRYLRHTMYINARFETVHHSAVIKRLIEELKTVEGS